MLSSCSLSGEYVRRVSHDYVTYSVFTSFSIHDAIPISLGHIALAVIPGVTGLGIGLVLIAIGSGGVKRSEEHTSELQSRGLLVCRSLLEIKYTQLESTSTSQHTV